MKPTLVILAAGLGSRYGGLKQMDQFGPSGETIIEYSIFDAIRAGFDKIVFVIRESMAEDLKDTIIRKAGSRIEMDYVFQDINHIPSGYSVPKEREKPWGTAHAVLAAEPKVHGPFVVINADDFYGFESYEIIAHGLSDLLEDGDNSHLMVGYQLKNTISEFGAVSRGVCKVDESGYLSEIVERSKIKEFENGLGFPLEDGTIQSLSGDEIVSMNFWGFKKDAFNQLNADFKRFLDQNINNITSEFYIPWAINEWIANDIAEVRVLTAKSSWFGVTYREDKEFVQRSLNKLIEEGKYPSNLWE